MKKKKLTKIDELIRDGHTIINHCRWNILNIKKNVNAMQKEIVTMSVRIKFDE